MKTLSCLSNDAKQTFAFSLNDGSRVSFSFEYISANQGWFMSLSYGNKLTIRRRRVVTSPNMIRAFRDIIPFGVSCSTTDGHEPIYKDDFTSKRAVVCVLQGDDIPISEEIIRLIGS